MTDRKQFFPLAGLALTVGIGLYMVAQLAGQRASIEGDFTAAAQAEVRNPQGQVLLRGAFVLVDENDGEDEIERRVTFQPTEIDPDAAGEAEVEFVKSKPGDQEIEFSVRNLEPGLVLGFVIDGRQVATATVDKKGRAETEFVAKIKGR